MNRPPVFSTLCGALALGLGAMGLSSSALAVAGDKGARDQARAGAKASYEAEQKQCDGKPGNAKDVCVAQAKANRVRAEATAEAAYKGTEGARFAAAKDVADADYKLAKEKCDDQTGPAKGVCEKEARAEMIKAKADAKAARRTDKAQGDAAKEKRAADYKVAVGKCDALSGDAKGACLLKAKTTYGQ